MNNRNEKIKKITEVTATLMLCTTTLDLLDPKASAANQNHDSISTNSSASSIYVASSSNSGSTAALQSNNNNNGNVESNSSSQTVDSSSGTSVPNEFSTNGSKGTTNDTTSSSVDQDADDSNVSNDFNVAVSFISNQRIVGMTYLPVQDSQEIDLTSYVPGGYRLNDSSGSHVMVHKGQNNINIPVDLISPTLSNSTNSKQNTNNDDDQQTGSNNRTLDDTLPFPQRPTTPHITHHRITSHHPIKKRKRFKAVHIQKQKQYEHPIKMPARVITPKTPTRINHHRIKHTKVRDPMLRPGYNSDRISNPKNFRSQVHTSMKHIPKNLHRIHGYHNFDKSVLRYRPMLRKITKHYHMRRYDDLFLAIMEVESKGNGKDIMQSSESAGLKPNALEPDRSIEQAVRYMKSITDKAKAMDWIEHHDKKVPPNDYHDYSQDDRLLAQTYDYGGGFLDYVAHSKYGYSEAMSERYSKYVVAKQLGNLKDRTYSYHNPIAEMYHKHTLYQNGGNYVYGDEVSQYLISGYMKQIMHNLIQYRGRPYVFGGKTPQTDFDCSGLVSYGFKTIGLHNFPDFTVTQWHATKPVKKWNHAKPGDLIFFKGTYGKDNFISHVGFLVDQHTMLDSNDHGVEFTSLDQPYWKQHFAGIHRVPHSHQLDKMALLKK